MSVDVELREYYCPYCSYTFVAEKRTLNNISIKKISSSVVCPNCRNNLKITSGVVIQ